MKNEWIRIGMAALYARQFEPDGLAPKKSWMRVESLLRSKEASIYSHETLVAELAEAGFWFEARLLSDGRFSIAEVLVRKGKVLTCVDEQYPTRWAQLGPLAPPVLYVKGVWPEGKTYTIVGSRNIDLHHKKFARDAGYGVRDSGGIVASGGAPGIDRSAVRSVQSLEIWPMGLNHSWGGNAALVLSVAAPNEGFSNNLAMERNALLYALSERTLVAHARLKEGGSWHGAINAYRKRLTRLYVPDFADPGLLALRGLGATPIVEPQDFVADSGELETSDRLFA